MMEQVNALAGGIPAYVREDMLLIHPASVAPLKREFPIPVAIRLENI
jgi:hypothetical protein